MDFLLFCSLAGNITHKRQQNKENHNTITYQIITSEYLFINS